MDIKRIFSPNHCRWILSGFLIALPLSIAAQPSPATRPFGTLRDQADTQQRWLAARMTTVLPAIMRYGIRPRRITMRDDLFGVAVFLKSVS